MRRQLDMDDLLASVSEEATLMAERDAAAATQGVDAAETRRLEGLIIDVVKREVEAEGEGDGAGDQGAKAHGSGSGWQTGARYLGTLGVIFSLLLVPFDPAASSAAAAPSSDATSATAAMSSSAEMLSAPVLAAATPTSALPRTYESIPIPENPPKVGDMISGGFWAHTRGDAWTYQVTHVERRASFRWDVSGHSSASSTATGVWKIVHVRLMNSGKVSRQPYTREFQLLDQDRNAYELDRGMSSLYSHYNDLSSFGTMVPPGVWIEMGLVTDIPSDAQGLMLCILQAGTMVDLDD